GALETVKGWKYNEVMGMHSSGPSKPPEPPVLNGIIVYVQERGGNWMGYRLNVPPEAQSEAISGVRKVHVPDLLLPGQGPATTQAVTVPKGLLINREAAMARRNTRSGRSLERSYSY